MVSFSSSHNVTCTCSHSDYLCIISSSYSRDRHDHSKCVWNVDACYTACDKGRRTVIDEVGKASWFLVIIHGSDVGEFLTAPLQFQVKGGDHAQCYSAQEPQQEVEEHPEHHLERNTPVGSGTDSLQGENPYMQLERGYAVNLVSGQSGGISSRKCS